MQKKTIFITGSSSGIGLSTVQYFLEKGWQVAAVTRKKSLSLRALESSNCIVIVADIKNKNDIKKAQQTAVQTFGNVDVVVNNAGYGLLGPVETATEKQVQEQIETNLTSIIFATQVFSPLFREQKSGVFVNISSMMGKVPFPFLSLYNATKFAVEGFSEAVAYELESSSVQVKLIEPGSIKTNFFSTSLQVTETKKTVYEQPFQKILNSIKNRGSRGVAPELVAETIWRAVHDGRAFGRYVPDKTAKLLITLRAITPVSLLRVILPKTI